MSHSLKLLGLNERPDFVPPRHRGQKKSCLASSPSASAWHGQFAAPPPEGSQASRPSLSEENLDAVRRVKNGKMNGSVFTVVMLLCLVRSDQGRQSSVKLGKNFGSFLSKPPDGVFSLSVTKKKSFVRFQAYEEIC